MCVIVLPGQGLTSCEPPAVPWRLLLLKRNRPWKICLEGLFCVLVLRVCVVRGGEILRRETSEKEKLADAAKKESRTESHATSVTRLDCVPVDAGIAGKMRYTVPNLNDRQ